MLTPKGKLYGDLTVGCLAEDHYMIFGSGAAQDMHRRWFEQHLPASGVSYRNATDAWHGIAIAGPRSRELLSRLTRSDVTPEAFKFFDLRRMTVGGAPSIVARVSFTGELGYEIYCAPQFQLALFEAIEREEKELGLKLFGNRALMSLRLEKSWGV